MSNECPSASGLIENFAIIEGFIFKVVRLFQTPKMILSSRRPPPIWDATIYIGFAYIGRHQLTCMLWDTLGHYNIHK